MDIADKLKAARKKLGLSQSQAAKKWGIIINNIQNWEQRKATPRGLALSALETILERAAGKAKPERKLRRKD